MKRELEERIAKIKLRIEKDQQLLKELEAQYSEVLKQEKERQQYLASSDIINIIKKHTGKESNMATIKRWADQGYLGDIVDERKRFWALKSKQGKKRFLYPKKNVYQFLYKKGFIQPVFNVIDRVKVMSGNYKGEIGVVVKSDLVDDVFCYTIQLEKDFSIVQNIPEQELVQVE
ncbi:hypothetical protein J2S00_001011 [Caldalkalibacillus uzonensis]|uniref:KOW domain-containing protein n=1 Tax=Caldalkalibacillus uzonensis TaxID=353224 RepID=A0ABU0CP88_9BACI|nr:KOW motif-containing protein [Caldalkalibacillus uzonensis]MDQ0338227.1 hypothetical protein [Caldalkalibacillus uzonensis]